MKATDLMIGDWVSYKGIVNRIAPADFGIYEEHSVWRENLEPIPLTAEILERNGWKKWRVYFRLLVGDGDMFLEYYPHEQRLEEIYIGKERKFEIVFRAKAIKYVHELQHALRLCGVDREITR